MATNARRKINQMSREQIIKEMTEWENKKELHNPRYIQLKKEYPYINTESSHNISKAPAVPAPAVPAPAE